MNDRLWELLAGYYTNGLNAEEKAELERLLLEHPDNWVKTGLLQQLKWELQPFLSSPQADKIADRILNEELKKRKNNLREITKTSFRQKNWKLLSLLAGIICIVTTGWYVFHSYYHKEQSVLQVVTTTDGMRSSLRLADGSEVWLNAGSAMRYPENFNSKSREVYLTGEAYFKIKHDASRPFIVHTANMNIKVLGTEFDVQAYPDEAYSTTSLIKGAVEVILKQDKNNQKIFLKPDQKVMIKNESAMTDDSKDNGNIKQVKPMLPTDSASTQVVLQPLKIMSDDIIPETAWKENVMVFEDETLSSLAQRLNRWYGVNIMIEDSTLAQQHFTGRADNVSLDKLLHILQLIKPFQYTIKDKEVIIK